MRNLLFGIALATFAGISDANAQGYPTRAVTAIVPASAGGPTDTIARIAASKFYVTGGEQKAHRHLPNVEKIIRGAERK